MLDFPGPGGLTVGQVFTSAGKSWQWDGTKWVKISDWISPMKDKVRPLLEAAAKDYVAKNQPWPARTETCDKSS